MIEREEILKRALAIDSRVAWENSLIPGPPGLKATAMLREVLVPSRFTAERFDEMATMAKEDGVTLAAVMAAVIDIIRERRRENA